MYFRRTKITTYTYGTRERLDETKSTDVFCAGQKHPDCFPDYSRVNGFNTPQANKLRSRVLRRESPASIRCLCHGRKPLVQDGSRGSLLKSNIQVRYLCAPLSAVANRILGGYFKLVVQEATVGGITV